jgi:hypothetical protein
LLCGSVTAVLIIVTGGTAVLVYFLKSKLFFNIRVLSDASRRGNPGDDPGTVYLNPEYVVAFNP